MKKWKITVKKRIFEKSLKKYLFFMEKKAKSIKDKWTGKKKNNPPRLLSKLNIERSLGLIAAVNLSTVLP